MEFNEQELLQKIRASLVEQAAAEGVDLDEAQLDELSKKTLGSYVTKATADHGIKMVGVGSSGERGNYDKVKADAASAAKRLGGVHRAVKKLTEEELEDHLIAVLGEEAYAQLDELSKKTLGSYINKATDDVHSKAVLQGANRELKQTSDDRKDRARAEDSAYDQVTKRKVGINTAVKKLTRESIEEHLIDVLGEEAYAQLDELSKKTLGSYIRGAEEDGREHEFNGGAAAANRDHNAQDHHQAKARKRSKGINTAVKKLTRESIDEMIAAAHEGKPVQFAAAFDTALRNVIDDKIEDQRHSVAAGLFGDKE